MSRTFLYGSWNGTPFQRSTITFDDVPIRGGIGERRRRLRHQRRRPRVGGQDRRAEAQSGFPRGCQGQRRQPVATVGFGRPDVGVAEVGELLDLLALGVEVARKGHGHAWSDRQRHAARLEVDASSGRFDRPARYFQWRMMQL
jgi:hypothetical protein